ncbi:Uncharacterised protein [Acinetobacter baumannii]|nr:Uncharacterised protein [Acinetobacter baumannii]
MLAVGTAEVREAHLGNVVMHAQQTELQLNFLLRLAFALFQVPLALLAPAETDGALRRHQLAAAAVDSNGFPLGIVFLAQSVHQIGGAQQAAGGVVAAFTRLQQHQHRHVGIAAHVVAEVADFAIEMELFQHHMAHRQRHRAVGALLRIQPVVANFGVVRRHRHGFGALVTHFGKEVGVRGARLRHVGAPGDDVGGVVPVGGLRHVGLLAPGHRRSRRQIAIPVVEAQAGAADQRQVTGTGGVGHHRHRRDRREADDTVRAEGFGGIDVGSGDQFIDLLPAGADEAAAAARHLVAFGFFRIADDRSPGLDRIAVLRFRLAPQFEQPLAHQRVFQPVGAVQIPGVAGAARAAARFMVGQVGAGARIVGLLGFPGHQTILHVDLPTAGTGAVHAVGGTHHFVMLPTAAVAVFPVAVGVQGLAMIARKRLRQLLEIAETV